MFPVADDFAAIARRLKEIEAEVANERAAVEARRQAEDEHQPDSQDVFASDNMSACA
jgi:hypothetical protein